MSIAIQGVLDGFWDAMEDLDCPVLWETIAYHEGPLQFEDDLALLAELDPDITK